MEPEFWHNKWHNNELGFHNETVHPLLADHWHKLSLDIDSRVFVPLCGKTRDIAWLLSKGYKVVGAELSEIAIQQLFKDLNLEPKVDHLGALLHYHTDNLDIFVGDIFDINHELIGTVDASYDRAALVALPTEMRERYTAHLVTLTKAAPQLLICFEYDQQTMNGPPFSIETPVLSDYYQHHYQLNLIETVEVEGGLKGHCPAVELVWLLENKAP
jgi:thiopurine S-methyltransferase